MVRQPTEGVTSSDGSGFRYLVGLHVPAGEVFDAVHEAVLRHLVVGPQKLLKLEHTVLTSLQATSLTLAAGLIKLAVVKRAIPGNPPSPVQSAPERGTM